MAVNGLTPAEQFGCLRTATLEAILERADEYGIADDRRELIASIIADRRSMLDKPGV